MVLSLGAYVNEATAAPTPLNACGVDLDTGTYVLTQNISSTTVYCFKLIGNDITIDLNGFTITREGDLNNIGIWDGDLFVGPRLENIVIRNGTIRNFNQGIWIDESDGCKVEGITAIGNGAGIIVGNHCVVSHNIAFNNSIGGGGSLLAQTAP
ncbi:MAG: Beta helix protein [Candidatus Dadabacteria bacterium]|nr:Beta helix protein [Candidatus Dadabacteria bacterium]